MLPTKTAKPRKETSPDGGVKRLTPNDRVEEITGEIERLRVELGNRRGSSVYLFLVGGITLGAGIVDEVFDDLRAAYPNGNEKLEVVVHSPGGDVHAAYNLARLFRRYATAELNFIVPRWSKSAATLLVCGGNKILMTPIAELGPVDPQITQMNPYERRLETISPLYMEATLELIRKEFANGHNDLADGLLKRLQFPLTLGGFQISLEVAKDYMRRLLTTRMFADEDEDEASNRAKTVAHCLVEDYTDHGFCIDVEEAQRVGLKAEELTPDDLETVWKIHNLNEEKEDLERQQKKQRMEDMMKSLPHELLRIQPMSPNTNGHTEVQLHSSLRTERGSLCSNPISTPNAIKIAINLAALILKEKGEISVEDIRAIPLLVGERDANEVISYLMENYDIELLSRRVAKQSMLQMEQVLRVRN